MEINRDYMTDAGSYDWVDPTHVCIHYTGGSGRRNGETARANAVYFAREGASIYSGCHYFVGDDGIYASTPETRGSWTEANYGANTHCISIEVVGTDGEGFSEREIELLGELVPDIMKRHGIDADHVIRHYDVVDYFPAWHTTDAHKHCPADYIDPRKWAALKDRIVNGGPRMNLASIINAPDGYYLWTGQALHKLETDEEMVSVRGMYEKDGSTMPTYTFSNPDSVRRIKAVLAR